MTARLSHAKREKRALIEGVKELLFQLFHTARRIYKVIGGRLERKKGNFEYPVTGCTVAFDDLPSRFQV